MLRQRPTLKPNNPDSYGLYFGSWPHRKVDSIFFSIISVLLLLLVLLMFLLCGLWKDKASKAWISKMVSELSGDLKQTFHHGLRRCPT